MLKLDPETCDIPVLTYTTEAEGQDFGTVCHSSLKDDSVFPSRAALRMNQVPVARLCLRKSAMALESP